MLILSFYPSLLFLVCVLSVAREALPCLTLFSLHFPSTVALFSDTKIVCKGIQKTSKMTIICLMMVRYLILVSCLRVKCEYMASFAVLL